MRKLVAEAEVAFGRFGAFDRQVNGLLVRGRERPTQRARLTQKRPADAKSPSRFLLRQSQVIESKGH